jgi:hypothetical protein
MRRLAVILAVGACVGDDRPAPRNDLVRVTVTHAGAARRLAVSPVGGARINALLPPVLETATGAVHFTAPARTADSAYFTAPPTATVAAPTEGTLHVSVCPPDVAVCRTVALPVRVR